jgi:hypothetical protein
MQLYVRPFDSNKPDTPAGPAVQLTSIKAGVGGLPSWRKDGKELYFMNIDREVLAVDVTTSPRVQAGMPRSCSNSRIRLPAPPPSVQTVSDSSCRCP